MYRSYRFLLRFVSVVGVVVEDSNAVIASIYCQIVLDRYITRAPFFTYHLCFCRLVNAILHDELESGKDQ